MTTNNVGAVTIRRNDSSAPSSTAALDTVVNETPPVPVACWPILAPLAFTAVLLMTVRCRRAVR